MNNFKRIVIILSKTSGRDKSCRIFQYFGKYLGEQLKEFNQLESSKKWLALGSNMSMTRKVLRFGRTIGIVIAILELSKSKKHKGIVISNILMNISALLYFLVDHTHWFCKIKVIDNPVLEAKADWLSDTLWIFEAFFDCIGLSIQILDDEENKDKLFELKLDLLRAFLDLLCAFGFSTGKIKGKHIGAMGTISTIIGLRQQWLLAK